MAGEAGYSAAGRSELKAHARPHRRPLPKCKQAGSQVRALDNDISPDADDLLAKGAAYHRRGRLAEAEACYREILSERPDQEDALHLLGVIAKQSGQYELAVELIGRAVRKNGENSAFFSNLGNALREQGKVEEAVVALRRALAIQPDLPEAYANLGHALREQDCLEGAAKAYRRAAEIRPYDVESHANFGAALYDQGFLAEAIMVFRHAIVVKPDAAAVLSNLGNALKHGGALAESARACRRAIAIEPGYAEAHSNLGNALRELGELVDAVIACRKALILKPDYAEAYCNLGIAEGDGGESASAEDACLRAIKIRPDYAEAYCNLGVALDGQARLAAAGTAYRRSIAIKPEYEHGYCNLGNVFKDQGLIEGAMVCYRRALELEPGHAVAHSNLLLALNYQPALSAGVVTAEHMGWDARHGCVCAPVATGYDNDRDFRRRLRIGYVSPDFRQHSVAYFLEPLLREHDRSEIEVFCYAEVVLPDEVTERLCGLVDHWLTTVGMTDEALAERIRDDRIDILVDLAGHTRGNRLLTFSYKPAPVQVSWLGYPNTTGMVSIDYRLVDEVTDPEGEADAWASERLVRVAGGFLCYAGPEAAPKPAAPPCLTSDAVTFGSFNNPTKLSFLTLETWAALLRRLPSARLVLKGKPFLDAETREIFLARFTERGVSAEQVALLGYVAGVANHLALYDRIDVALDPFPYNGTTTTCEALWMGVPVVSLEGGSHAGRVGASLLHQVGLTELLAGSTQDYVEIAVALAGNRQRLKTLRSSLRERMASSALCDTLGFVRKMESTYRTLWQHWCEMP